MSEAQCVTCVHFRQNTATSDLGECRRYPPVLLPNRPIHEDRFEFLWPKVYRDDYCGEWKHKPEAAS